MMKKRKTMNDLEYAAYNARCFPVYGFDDVYHGKYDGYAYQVSYENGEYIFRKIKPVQIDKDGTPYYYLFHFNRGWMTIGGDVLTVWSHYGYADLPVTRKLYQYENCQGIHGIRYIIPSEPIKIDEATYKIGNEIFKRYPFTREPVYINEYGAAYSPVPRGDQIWGRFLPHRYQEHFYLRVPIPYERCIARHWLSYSAWTGNPVPDGMQVNHKDGRKWNNHYTNLEVLTPYENRHRAIANNIGGPATYSEEQIHEVCRMMQEGYKSSVIAKTLGVGVERMRALTNAILHEGRWRHVANKYDFTKYRNMNRRITFSDEQIHEICKLRESDKYSRQEIAEMTGIPISTVNEVCKGKARRDISSQYNMHLETVRHPLTEKYVRSVCEDLMAGKTLKEVAESWGKSEEAIRDLLRRRGQPDITCQYHFELVYPNIKYVNPYKPPSSEEDNQQPST